MGKPNLKAIKHGIAKCVRKNSPAMLLALGIASGVSAVVLAVKKTSSAKDEIYEETQIKQHETGDKQAKLTPKEVFRVVWKKYIPVVALVVTSIILILSSSGVVHRRYEALSSAYGLLAASNSEYVDKVIETVGQHKEQTIREEIAKDKMRKVEQVTNPDDIVKTGHGETRMVDTLGGREFYASIDYLKSVQNRLNKQIIDSYSSGCDAFVTLNDLYDEIGLAGTKFGEMHGWTCESCYDKKNFIELDFVAMMAADGETPIVGVVFKNLPVDIYPC